MVKLLHLAIAGLGLLFLMKKSNATSPAEAQAAVAEWQQLTQGEIPNTISTENILGDLNPFTGGPQTIANPLGKISNFDYSPWGGTVAEGGYQFAMINGVNVRNPSLDLVFVRGEGVYR